MEDIKNDSLVVASEVREMFILKVLDGMRDRIFSLAGTLMDDQAFHEVTEILIQEVCR